MMRITMQLIILLFPLTVIFSADGEGVHRDELTDAVFGKYQVVFDKIREALSLQRGGHAIFSVTPREDNGITDLIITDPSSDNQMVSITRKTNGKADIDVLTLFIPDKNDRKKTGEILFDKDWDGIWDEKIVLNEGSFSGAKRYFFHDNVWLEIKNTEDKKGHFIEENGKRRVIKQVDEKWTFVEGFTP